MLLEKNFSLIFKGTHVHVYAFLNHKFTQFNSMKSDFSFELKLKFICLYLQKHRCVKQDQRHLYISDRIKW